MKHLESCPTCGAQNWEFVDSRFNGEGMFTIYCKGIVMVDSEEFACDYTKSEYFALNTEFDKDEYYSEKYGD